MVKLESRIKNAGNTTILNKEILNYSVLLKNDYEIVFIVLRVKEIYLQENGMQQKRNSLFIIFFYIDIKKFEFHKCAYFFTFVFM